MGKKKNLPAVISAEENEALFFAALNARAESHRRGVELARMQRALVHSEMRRAEEKRASAAEMDGLVRFVFVSVIALLVIVVVCVLAAPICKA